MPVLKMVIRVRVHDPVFVDNKTGKISFRYIQGLTELQSVV
jgi:hypothetical protein